MKKTLESIGLSVGFIISIIILSMVNALLIQSELFKVYCIAIGDVFLMVFILKIIIETGEKVMKLINKKKEKRN